jgi:hypothetical protein
MRLRCYFVVGNDNMPLKRSEKRKDANGIIVDMLAMGRVK